MTTVRKSIGDATYDYATAHSQAPDEIAQALIDETRALGGVSRMQVAAEQSALLTQLVALTRARFAVEVGTFTGLSALAIARGLPPGGRLLCCDVSDEWTRIGRPYWERAGVADRIDLRIGPAAETLAALPAEEAIDFAFIDADKPNYRTYYELVLERVAPTGLICVDNVLWSGSVAKPPSEEDDENLTAIRAFNEHVLADPRVDVVMIYIGDGMSLIRPRAKS